MRRVVLCPYDKNWQQSFECERSKIADILAENCVEIVHVGSTAIPGIYAKPVIDIMPVVNDLAQVDNLSNAFARLGYLCKGEYGIAGRRFYMKGGEQRTHHVHLFERGNPQIARHLAFRDYLRQHPQSAQAYSQIKRDLAIQFFDNSVAYVKGKGSFIRYIDYVTGHAQQDQLRASDSITLSPYDVNWKKIAAAEIASIKHVVKLPLLDIQHLGSTAIQGILAKPTIDIFIALETLEQAMLWVERLQNLGYVYWHENPNKQHLRFFKGMPPYGINRTHHVHIMQQGQKFVERIRFCDILNESSVLREEYQQLKQTLADHYAEDREAYTNNKAQFIERILRCGE